jgi:hypothetical protein
MRTTPVNARYRDFSPVERIAGGLDYFLRQPEAIDHRTTQDKAAVCLEVE